MVDEDAYLGEFRRGPAIFTVFALDKTHNTHNGNRRIRVDCNDGNGPSEVCTFTLNNAPDTAPGDASDGAPDSASDRAPSNNPNSTGNDNAGEAPADTTQWHGAWQGDEWCSWIEAEIRKVLAQ
ncbi:hypothetical protein [Glycomyces arizonensis]|uniref:hypothetical protein n=1 Tax=Glycomyces arizonensis TaxID=256035 RepID=UPI000412208E|nr:hypothetical protein [Glycomyces arizonensis]